MNASHKSDIPVSKAAPADVKKERANVPFRWNLMLLLITIFQLFSFFPVAFADGKMNETLTRNRPDDLRKHL